VFQVLEQNNCPSLNLSSVCSCGSSQCLGTELAAIVQSLGDTLNHTSEVYDISVMRGIDAYMSEFDLLHPVDRFTRKTTKELVENVISARVKFLPVNLAIETALLQGNPPQPIHAQAA